VLVELAEQPNQGPIFQCVEGSPRWAYDERRAIAGDRRAGADCRTPVDRAANDLGHDARPRAGGDGLAHPIAQPGDESAHRFRETEVHGDYAIEVCRLKPQ